jgi:hypothetical protein
MHRRNPPAIICALVLIFSLTGCSSDPAPVPEGRQPAVIRPSSHDDLRDFMATQNYNWETLDEGVPPFILETLPADLHRIHQLTEKKRIFFLSLLPMVLLANEELAGQNRTPCGLRRFCSDREPFRRATGNPGSAATGLQGGWGSAGRSPHPQ